MDRPTCLLKGVLHMTMPSRPLPDDDEMHPSEPGRDPSQPKEPGPAPAPEEVPQPEPSQEPGPRS
jgi:hypothetical protein